MTLFDDFERVDPRPASYGEDSFTFLNRASGPVWERIRTELEAWFAEYPQEAAADVRSRFRSADPRQHIPAWWELYLHRLFTRLGFVVSAHPDVPDASTHPDFHVARTDGEFFVEAVTVFSGIVEEGRHGAREAWVLDLVNEAKNPNFFVGLDFDRVGTERPARREVVVPIEEWLAKLDPDAIAADNLPELRLTFRDWDVALEAFPVKQEARGKPDHRLLGRGPISGGWVNDVEQLQGSLGRKFKRYGALPHPLVVAVLGTSSFLDLNDVAQSLFGREAIQYDPETGASHLIRQRNGVWMGETGPRATSVAAVLSASGLLPWMAARTLPRLWHNPWADRPLDITLPFASASANASGAVEYTDGDADAATLLDLPVDWPGSEERFA